MTQVHSRDYAGEDDYGLMRSLIREAYVESGPDVAMTVGDLDYWRYQSADPDAAMRSCRLWLGDTGAVLGFAWPGVVEDEAGVIDLFAHPRHCHLIEPMLAWAEGWHTRRRPGRTITVEGREGDRDMTQALVRRAYTRTSSFSHWYRVRPINVALPKAVLPAGYAVRAADVGRDAEGVAATNNLSGAGPALTEASCRAIMTAPTYRSDLHIIATDRACTTIAAFCIVWYDAVNRFGLFEPVACAPAHRRRGLATAIMTEGLRRLHTLDATHALVACDGRNGPANRLYESLGFSPRGRSWKWTKSA